MISPVTKCSPSESLLAWIAEQGDEDPFIALVTAEIRVACWKGAQAVSVTSLMHGVLDSIIAAIAESSDCVVITDNENDFPGLNIINPLPDGAR